MLPAARALRARDRAFGEAWDAAIGAGDYAAGRKLYEERMCHRCHSASTRIGPDLTGVTARLARADLFIAIVDPSRDISPASRRWWRSSLLRRRPTSRRR